MQGVQGVIKVWDAAVATFCDYALTKRHLAFHLPLRRSKR